MAFAEEGNKVENLLSSFDNFGFPNSKNFLDEIKSKLLETNPLLFDRGKSIIFPNEHLNDETTKNLFDILHEIPELKVFPQVNIDEESEDMSESRPKFPIVIVSKSFISLFIIWKEDYFHSQVSDMFQEAEEKISQKMKKIIKTESLIYPFERVLVIPLGTELPPKLGTVTEIRLELDPVKSFFSEPKLKEFTTEEFEFLIAFFASSSSLVKNKEHLESEKKELSTQIRKLPTNEGY
jgi:hypothetical protein